MKTSRTFSTHDPSPTRFQADLTGQRVLVVGGTSPIGRAVADMGREAGADVTITTRNHPSTSDALFLDLGDETSIETAARHFGPCDHIITLAAARTVAPLDHLDAANMRSALEAKILGPALLAKHFHNQWSDQGSFTIVTGVADEHPSPGSLAMSAANGGANAMVRALALEMAPIRVNAISPGLVDTGSGEPKVLAEAASRLPVGRVATPDIIADALWAVALNPYMAGAVIPIDGGLRLT